LELTYSEGAHPASFSNDHNFPVVALIVDDISARAARAFASAPRARAARAFETTKPAPRALAPDASVQL